MNIVYISNCNLLMAGISTIDNDIVVLKCWIDINKMKMCNECSYHKNCIFTEGEFHPLKYYFKTRLLIRRPKCLSELIIKESLFVMSIIKTFMKASKP